MKLTDQIKLSQRNLLRSKLRTFLTIAAVFIGALALSLTNGVGNGIKQYVNTQLGNLGAKDQMLVQAKQPQANPTNTEVRKYDANKQVNSFNFVVLSSKDLDKIKNIAGVQKVVPQYDVHLEYIATGDDKYEVTSNQYVDGLNLEMIAGRTVNPSSDTEITVPSRYIKPGTEQDSIGKNVVIGYKNSSGKTVERQLTLVGVQQQSLLGNQAANISDKLAEEIYHEQTAGVANLSDSYAAVLAKFDSNYSKTQIDDLKKRIQDAGYSARTLEDQVGTVAKVINAILLILNIFGAITLLAAGFGIINTLLMSVNERTPEIGLMKALGADRRTIFSIFALEAMSLGFWGALLGVVVSIVLGTIASNIAARTFLKEFIGFRLLAFPILPSLGVLLGIMVLAFLAGALPALKASKLDPIKALRYE